MTDSVYHAHGIQFRYPSDWQLSEQEGDREVTISVQSPGTSFWTVSLFYEQPEPEDLVETAVEAFQEEYDEVDLYPAQAHLCHRPNVAQDLDFVCFDMVNSAFLRAFATADYSVLVMYQGDDQELEATRPELERISTSLICAAEGFPG